MSIQERVKEALKRAMKSVDKDAKNILRVIIGEFNRVGKEVDDKAAIAILKKMKQNAQEQDNKIEVTIIEQFLPSQLSTDDLTTIIKETIHENGFEGMKDMGKVMGLLQKEFGGQYDGKIASTIVKENL